MRYKGIINAIAALSLIGPIVVAAQPVPIQISKSTSVKTIESGSAIGTGSVIPGKNGAGTRVIDPSVQTPVNDELSDLTDDQGQYAIFGGNKTTRYVENPVSGVISNRYKTSGSTAAGSENSEEFVTEGELKWMVNGIENTLPYYISSNDEEDALLSLKTLKEKLNNKVNQGQIISSPWYGSLSNPKSWSTDTTPGEIHYGSSKKGQTFFESKFTGNAAVKKAYYPENGKDNDYWKIVHPVEYYVISSDPQYARTPDTVDDEKNAAPVIKRQYEELNRIKNLYGDAFRGTIINGDITDFGHKWQWSFMNDALNKLNHNYWYGLGNHDYANNVNDCFNNNCAIRSMRNLVEHIKTLKYINSVDYSVISGYKFPVLTTSYIGSFSYSFDISGLRFIQLNDAGYTVEFEGYMLDKARRYKFNVTKGHEWAEEQMADARKKGKGIIMLSHSGVMFTKTYSELFRKYNPGTEFYGHFHLLSSNSSGATFQEEFIFLEVDNLKRALRVYTVRNNDFNKRQLSATFPLYTDSRDIEFEKSRSFTISLKNGGGYIGYYTLNYTRGDGSSFSEKYRLALGNSVQKVVPGDAKNIHVKGVTRTGRALYDVQLKDYKNVCLKSWGTLPRNLKWGWC